MTLIPTRTFSVDNYFYLLSYTMDTRLPWDLSFKMHRPLMVFLQHDFFTQKKKPANYEILVGRLDSNHMRKKLIIKECEAKILFAKLEHGMIWTLTTCFHFQFSVLCFIIACPPPSGRCSRSSAMSSRFAKCRKRLLVRNDSNKNKTQGKEWNQFYR